MSKKANTIYINKTAFKIEFNFFVALEITCSAIFYDFSLPRLTRLQLRRRTRVVAATAAATEALLSSDACDSFLRGLRDMN